MSKATNFASVNSPAARAYDTADSKNRAGHKAWTKPLREQVVQMLLTNTLDNTFYASSNELAKGCHNVYKEILVKDPEFLAKAIVYARNNGMMRLQPIVGLVYLSTVPQDQKHLFYAAFRQTIKTPHDLATFVEWCKVGGIRQGLGRSVKDAVNGWLRGLSEYHVIKYPLNGQWSMRNIMRLTKPVPANEQQSALFNYAVNGAQQDTDAATKLSELLPQVGHFEAAKRFGSTGNYANLRKSIEAGRLPYETITGVVKPDVETWRYLARQMPQFALLRHLNALDRAGALDAETTSYVASQLSNPDAVRKSRVLPFRYYTAWLAYTRDGSRAVGWGYAPSTRSGANQKIADALVQALEVSYENLPVIPGNTIIGNDVSGSMGSLISGKGTTRYCDIAGIFGAALFKKSENVTLLPADTSVRLNYTSLSRYDSVLTNATKLAQASGGTDLGAAIRYVNEHGLPMDTYIGITDSEEWMTTHGGWGYASRGFYGEWKARKNKDAKAFLVRIDPYRTNPAPSDDKSVHTIYGWSANVLDYITLTLNGMGGQVQAVENIQLT